MVRDDACLANIDLNGRSRLGDDSSQAGKGVSCGLNHLVDFHQLSLKGRSSHRDARHAADDGGLEDKVHLISIDPRVVQDTALSWHGPMNYPVQFASTTSPW